MGCGLERLRQPGLLEISLGEIDDDAAFHEAKLLIVAEQDPAQRGDQYVGEKEYLQPERRGQSLGA
jgi:hypothetical protein